MLKQVTTFAVLFSLSVLFLTGCAATPTPVGEQVVSLNGEWRFIPDKNNQGMNDKWFEPQFDRSGWQQVRVPHTWQTIPGLESHYGNSWYARTIKLDCPIKDKLLKLEFDAVNRDTEVWVNGIHIGEHKGSGYTPFSFIIPAEAAAGGNLQIVLRVSNGFSRKALPYDRSYDWTTDGGIIRSARIKILPQSYIDNLLVDAEPSADFSQAKITARLIPSSPSKNLSVQATILDQSGNIVSSGSFSAEISIVIEKPVLWHFDKPYLYRLVCRLMSNGKVIHEKETTFGIRKVKVKDGFYFLNGEPMRLMGVEWMPGSDPRLGFAETPEYVQEVLEDMKKLNCVLTRFHWQQDDSVWEFCDREGILAQEEIPTWGGATRLEQLGDIQLMQMREMILSHYNHPSIYAWGLCNEIAGQSPQGRKFVSDGVEIAHKLNPARLLTYASNTVQQNPKQDAAQYLDFIEWNEYFGSWAKGDTSNLAVDIDRITKDYPDKTLVISEYGLCECAPSNPSGDVNRIEIMTSHTDVFRKSKSIAGAIFFCYNDYRTHIGDKDRGAFRQRVHGVVDLLNQPKPSWQVLREESSPVKSITITSPEPDSFNIEILTRSLENDLPAYTLRDYLLIWRTYNSKGQPVESGQKILPDLKPGSKFTESIKITRQPVAQVKAEIFRPTGYSVLDTHWPE